MFYLNQLFRIWQTPKFRLFFTATTMKSELEGNIKSRSLFPLDILEFDNKGISGDPVLYWMPLTGIFTRLPTSIFEKFHYQTFFLLLRNHSTDFSDIGHWSNLTLCYVSSPDLNKKNIYSHSIFLILQFLTFSVHLEIQNYKFCLTKSLLQTRYFSVPQPTHSLVTVSLDYWKTLLSLLHYF